MRQVRAIFVSDAHLGCRHAKVEELLQFLKDHQPDYLYLVGDMVDGWKLCRVWHWPETYNRLVRRILKLIKRGTKVFYTPGNHDAFLRNFISNFGGVEIADEFVHTTASGERILVLHGDQFDGVVRHARFLSMLGDIGYDLLLHFNGLLNAVRRKFGMRYWSLSASVKRKVKQATNFISNFEGVVTKYASTKGCDGVVCGHIHTPVIRRAQGATYYNSGDWVESCSALVEYADGQIELVFPLASPARPAVASPDPLLECWHDEMELAEEVDSEPVRELELEVV